MISHLSTNNERIAKCFQDFIYRVFLAYPRNTIWLMMGSLESGSIKLATRMNKIIEHAREKSDTKIPVIIQVKTDRGFE